MFGMRNQGAKEINTGTMCPGLSQQRANFSTCSKRVSLFVVPIREKLYFVNCPVEPLQPASPHLPWRNNHTPQPQVHSSKASTKSQKSLNSTISSPEPPQNLIWRPLSFQLLGGKQHNNTNCLAAPRGLGVPWRFLGVSAYDRIASSVSSTVRMGSFHMLPS